MTKKIPGRAVLAVVTTLPLVLTLAVMLFAPRPYFIIGTDIGHDYYYQAHLLSDGKPLWGAGHPGIPAYYLGVVLVRILGTELVEPGGFFLAVYLSIALLTTLAFGVSLRLVHRRASAEATALFGACALAWPPSLAYLDYFGSDALILACGVPLLAVFWLVLWKVSVRRLAVLGGLSGLCLAVKFSFIPLVAILGAAVAVVSVRAWRARRLHGAALPVFLAAMLGSFAVATGPVFIHLPRILLRTVHRNVRPPSGGLGTALGGLAEASPLLVLTAGAAFVWMAGVVLRAFANRASRPTATPAGFDGWGAGVFVGLGLPALAYVLKQAGMGGFEEAGLGLRNASAMALVLPFLVLIAAQAVNRRVASARERVRRGVQVGLLVLAGAVVLYPSARHVAWRHAWIESTQARAERVQAALEERRVPGTRLAFWDGSPGTLLGRAGFHFWGDYRYANEVYTGTLLDAFPDRALLRFRDVGDLLDRRNGRPPEPRVFSTLGWFDRLFWRLPAVREGYAEREVGPLFSGESTAEPLATLAFPRAEAEAELHPYTLESFLDVVRERMGDVDVREETIAGTRWLIVAPLRALGEADR